MIEYSEELVRLTASMPEAEQPGGVRVAQIELGPTDKAWNPERNDTLLRGPAIVTYCFWADGGVDFRRREVETVESSLV